MSRFAASLLVLISLSTTASAQLISATTKLEPAERPQLAPQTIGEAVQRVRGQVHAAVINGDYSDSSFLIPIAGNQAGNFGTYFRSDLVLANYRAASQRIAIGWMASGIDNGSAPLTYFTLPANTTDVEENFVANVLGKTGIGSVLVLGVDTLGNNDSAASLDGFSRIWTYQPGTVGTVSQTFDAISLFDSIGSLTAYILGARQSADFRTNIGVVNLDSASHTWTATSMFNGMKTKFTVPPYSVVQTNVTANSANYGGHLLLTLTSDGSGFWWSAYASSVDNRTGDGWIARAKQ